MMNTLENQKGRTSKTNKTIPSIPFLHESRPSLHQNASGRLSVPARGLGPERRRDENCKGYKQNCTENKWGSAVTERENQRDLNRDTQVSAELCLLQLTHRAHADTRGTH